MSNPLTEHVRVQDTKDPSVNLVSPVSPGASGSSGLVRRTTTRKSSAPTNKSVNQPVLQRIGTTLSSMLIPEHKVGKPPGIWKELRAIALGSWINVLLVFIPVSWALHFATPDNYTLVFVFSFLAIIPLAKLLAFATDELSIRVGQTLAGLLNATLGNAVELIVAIIALVKCEIRVVQSSLLGSILSNLLLVLGMCFFAGGTRFSEQGFGISASQLNSSLLTLSVIGLLIPAAYDMVAGNNNITGYGVATEQVDILKVSHGVAVVLLFIYLAYLVFQLFSHKSLYDDTDNDGKPKTIHYAGKLRKKAEAGVQEPSTDSNLASAIASDVETGTFESETAVEEEEVPQLSVLVTVILLACVTVLVAITAEWLVDSINGLASTGKISKEFIGLILLPIVGNAAEHVTAVAVSVKDKLTLSLGVAVGSSIQIALFVIPFIVILGWIIGKPMTLLFDPFESIVLFLSVLTVNYVVQDGKSNWLEGMILMCLYLVIAVVFWFYPGTQLSGILAQC